MLVLRHCAPKPAFHLVNLTPVQGYTQTVLSSCYEQNHNRSNLLFLSGAFTGDTLSAAGKGLVEVDDGERIRYPGSPQLSPSGELIAFSEDGTIYVASERRPEPRALTAESNSAWDPTWSCRRRIPVFCFRPRRFEPGLASYRSAVSGRQRRSPLLSHGMSLRSTCRLMKAGCC